MKSVLKIVGVIVLPNSLKTKHSNHSGNMTLEPIALGKKKSLLVPKRHHQTLLLESSFTEDRTNTFFVCNYVDYITTT